MTDNFSNQQTPKPRIDWWIYSILFLLALAIAFYAIVQSRPGGLTGVMTFLLGPLAVAFFSIIFLLIGIIVSIIKRPFFTKWRLIGFGGLIALCFTSAIYGKYPSYYDDKPSKVEFRLPVDTLITVAWGGGEVEQNYHVEYPDQCWAYDLLLVKDGKTFSGDSTKKENYYCYGLKVVAPAKGKITEAYDKDPEMPIGALGGGKDPHGNHITIEVAPHEYLILCHLQPGSVKVNVGDSVAEGQELALIGNSGNTSEPHLHIHLQNSKLLSISEGIPLYFHHYTVDGKYIESGIPTGGFDDKGNFIGQTVQNVRKR